MLLEKKDEENDKFIDVSNLMPDFDTQVNIVEVAETQMVVRCIQDNKNSEVKNIVNKVSELYFKIK